MPNSTAARPHFENHREAPCLGREVRRGNRAAPTERGGHV